jgi:hypothetical protein
MRSARSVLRWSVAVTFLGVSVNVLADGSAQDISGVWSRTGADTSQLSVDPPLKPKYLKAYKASRQQQPPAGSTASGALEKCWVEGMPTIMAARAALEIVRTPGQVTVLAEYMGQTRRIFMDEKMPAPADLNPGYMGTSVGKWNGDTLEVQTLGIREDVRYQDIPHSGKMKILEKIRLTGPDQLQDDVVIHDPNTLTQPLRLTFQYRKDPQHRVMEYPCKRTP